MNIPNNLEEISKKYRRELFEKFLEVGQGHPGSVFSMLEIIVTLYYKNFIRFDPDLKKFKDKINYLTPYIPDRYKEGYGIWCYARKRVGKLGQRKRINPEGLWKYFHARN